MTILHLPSWFPNKKSQVSGIFTLKHIQAFSKVPGTNHIVLKWHDSLYASPKNPLIFISGFLKSLEKSRHSKVGNIHYVTFNLFQSKESIFGRNDSRLAKRVIRESLRLMKKENIDLIHAHVTYPAGFIAMKLSDRTGIPYIISEHMGPFPFEEYKSSVTWLDEHIVTPIRRSKKIIAVSNTQKQQIRELTGVEAAVIPNIVDEKEFSFVKSSPNGVFTFLLVAQLDINKGIDILLEASAIVARKRHDFIVKICGDGRILPELRKMAKDSGIEERVKWLGNLPRAEVVKNIQSCDCLVSSSRFESFGVTLVEAMACGKPVIATKSGGPMDIVNKENGILIETGDPKSLADAMEQMLDHAKDYNPDSIRYAYEKLYSTKPIAQRYYDEIYSKVS